ncbi:NUDIX hydrolase (plasmid) [Rhizobium sp. CB3060]|uniref:NUDIX hydrolase n=1 Tax=Rhizobium sp. CB3060 TaxID=3138255 RepID=UPI0021A8BE1A|nr:NUDIX hydrolase [Rhizobium tropici]UWU25662.1 NUDIX hydrolase [Rhizobium tropici]
MLRDSTRYDASSDDIAQAGAICYWRDNEGRIEVLLVAGRWGVPKGHIESPEPSGVAASTEAFEEAGIMGIVTETSFGTFNYQKDTSRNRYTVIVQLLNVSKVADKFPENIRKPRWFALHEAVRRATQPSIRALLARLGRENS